MGLVGVVSALMSGRLTGAIGPRRARLAILGAHALALTATLSTLGTLTWLFTTAVGIWVVFAWALNLPMQAGTIAAAPEVAMTAVSLSISGLYLGTVIAGALGGAILDDISASAIPLAGALLLAFAWLVAAPTIPPAPTVERHPVG